MPPHQELDGSPRFCEHFTIQCGDCTLEPILLIRMAFFESGHLYTPTAEVYPPVIYPMCAKSCPFCEAFLKQIVRGEWFALCSQPASGLLSEPRNLL
jgi:hypothetical protein